VVFIVIERLSFPCVNRGIGLAARVKSFRISTQFLNFHSKPGRVRSRRNSQKNERETFTERRRARPAHEILADSRKARTHRKLFKIEGKEKLLGFGPPTPGVG
jgi:hypothetical protein